MKIFQKALISSYFIIILLSSHMLNAQNYSWSQLNDFGGTVRFGVFSFVIGNYGYFGGGYANGTSVSDVWRYNPAGDSWTQMSNCPLPVRATGNFTLNGQGYVVCGLISGSTIVNDVFAYDPQSNTWSSKADFPGVAIYGGASFEINGKGYYGMGNGGGAAGPYYTALYEYNPITDSWNQKASFPGNPRYGTFGLTINGKGYAGLGGDDGIPMMYNDWYQYDAVSNSWTQKAFFTGAGRGYAAGFVINDMGFVVTGNISSTTMANDAFRYDPIADTWTSLPSFGGIGRWAAKGFAIGDTGYLGTGQDGVNYLRDFWKYAPDSTTSLIDLNMEEISIYPNPCMNSLVVQSNKFESLVSIEIINTNGQKIASLPNTGSRIIDMSNYSTGMYFVRLNSTTRSVTYKIFKL